MTKPDPLDAFPDFADHVRQRLDAGRLAYGDRSFSADPADLVAELQQEALDFAGWGFVLWSRLQAIQEALAAASGNLATPERAERRDTVPAPAPGAE